MCIRDRQNIMPRKFDLFVDLDTEVVPRSFANHVSLCNTLPSNKLWTKKAKIPVVKGLNYQKVWKLWHFFTILIFLFKLSKSMKIVTFFTILIFLFAPLTTNDRILCQENLTFLWTWTLRWYLGALQPMFLCVTLCPRINYVQKQWKSR